jgi:tryptophan-rich sensory protein
MTVPSPEYMSTGAKAGALVALMVGTPLLAYLVSMGVKNTQYNMPPCAPPKMAFPIIWTIMFALAGSALAVQAFYAPSSSWAQWVSLALLGAAVLGSMAWTYVYRSSRKGSIWYTVGLLALLFGGVMVRPGPYAALWAPWLAWFIYATVLGGQGCP